MYKLLYVACGVVYIIMKVPYLYYGLLIMDNADSMMRSWEAYSRHCVVSDVV